MILTSTESQIEGYWIAAYKGTVRDETWNELLRNAEEIGANAVINTCFDDAPEINTLFYCSAVILRPERSPHSLVRKPVHRKIRTVNWSDRWKTAVRIVRSSVPTNWNRSAI